MSKTRQLAQAVHDRVAQISIFNGYHTDIGTKIFRGKRTADFKEAPFAFVVEGDDDPLDQKMNQVRLTIQFVVEGHTACDADNPNDAVHDIVEDLWRAIFGGDDKTWGGILRGNHASPSLVYKGRVVGEREEGASIVGAAIIFTAEILEDLANP